MERDKKARDVEWHELAARKKHTPSLGRHASASKPIFVSTSIWFMLRASFIVRAGPRRACFDSALHTFARRPSPSFPIAPWTISIPRQILTRTYSTSNSNEPPPPPSKGFISRFLPSAVVPTPGGGASFRKIMQLAAPERRPLLYAIGLLVLSSSVSMSIPFTIVSPASPPRWHV